MVGTLKFIYVLFILTPALMVGTSITPSSELWMARARLLAYGAEVVDNLDVSVTHVVLDEENCRDFSYIKVSAPVSIFYNNLYAVVDCCHPCAVKSSSASF